PAAHPHQRLHLKLTAPETGGQKTIEQTGPSAVVGWGKCGSAVTAPNVAGGYLRARSAERLTDGLPGLVALEKVVGAMLTFGLVASVAGVVISAVAWAIGASSSNPHIAGRGKTGVIIAGAAAMLIGAANTLVTFFSNAGAAIQ
ncbi:DUF6112 family protein, partial [Intrasporangium sp.]|uniref:DUF6112 family protein n=1 Tax=Intrasporangium sp. TaxID=1925024 RepID=UPI0032216045